MNITKKLSVGILTAGLLATPTVFSMQTADAATQNNFKNTIDQTKPYDLVVGEEDEESGIFDSLPYD